jgi:cell pole-organizing protein PopZ
MEEILASIRRIINDVNDGPGNNLGNEPVRQEAASRERMRPNASPRAEASGGSAENLSRDGWSIARPVRLPADAQPVAGDAGPVVAAAPEPSQRSTRLMLSSEPRPASAEQEIDEILAQLHSGPHPELPADRYDVDDALETSRQMGVPEPLPADEFADPADLDHLDQPQEAQEPQSGEGQCEQEAHEEQAELPVMERAEPVHPMAGMQAAQSAPHYPKSPAPPSLRSKVHDRGGGNELGLVSAATSVAVDSAFNTLAQTVLVQNGPSLEDLVRQMLRPMLKTWLDDNLPGLVERLVRAEIERVSRGRG